MKKFLIAGAVALSFQAPAHAKPEPVQLLVANVPPTGSTKITSAYPLSTNGTWQVGPVLTADAPSTQKTIGASPSVQAIMYRKADGNTYIVPGQIGYGMGAWSANFPAGWETIVWMDDNQSQIAKFAPEEIEVHPTTGDIYALGAVSASAPKQIFRIRKNADGNFVAKAMTFRKNDVPTPNNQSAFLNPSMNGYKAGSLAFYPKPGGGHYLIFTHQSTVYQGICHWVFEMQGDFLESGGTQSINRCQKNSTVPLTGDFASNGVTPGGINTVYVGKRNGPGGAVIPAMLLISRDNGPLHELKIPGLTLPSSSSWQATQLADSPTGHSLGSDLAWYHNGLGQ